MVPNECNDKPYHVGGKQVINILDGYATPLECRSGLMYMSLLGKPTDHDLEEYPHVLLTSSHEWDPLSWTIHIPTHKDTLLGHLIHLLKVNMTQGLMNAVTSRIGLFRHYPFSQLKISSWFTNMS